MNRVFYYRFELRGIHSLERLAESLHGHHCFLRVGVHGSFSEEDEREFLLFMKNEILKDFDKADWRKALDKGPNKEPSGENVIQEIAKRLRGFKLSSSRQIKWAPVELQETRKNLFRLTFEEVS